MRSCSFRADQGEFLAIVGPSGSGKTTLLAMIGALLSPTEGTILVNGTNLTELSNRKKAEFRRKQVGFVFQANNVLPFLTARENLMVMGDIAGMSRADSARRADQLIEELGLAGRARAVVTELSATYHGYPGQVLRTFTVAAEPTPLYRRLHEVAEEALDSILGVVRAGAHARDLVAASAGI